MKSLFATPARQAGAFALAAVMVIALLLWVNQPDGLETELAQDMIKETAVAFNNDDSESSADQETAEIAAIAAEPTPDSTITTFLPILSAAVPTGPHLASLTDVQGFVQVQEAGGDWQTVTGTAAVAAGAQIRTGTLSSAKLTFFDNSQAHLGPDSGLTIEQLDAKQPDDGFRTVLLSQWQGESSHSVQFRHDGGSRYEVRTPDGSGVARGTQFQVAVSPEQFSRISVTEGRVDVSGSGRTVSVAAGSTHYHSRQRTALYTRLHHYRAGRTQRQRGYLDHRWATVCGKQRYCYCRRS
ncbi:MAG: FecR family protein [Chloroflexi bacterium]|nr:FecR family protein [Chloroflexota bacterium]